MQVFEDSLPTRGAPERAQANTAQHSGVITRQLGGVGVALFTLAGFGLAYNGLLAVSSLPGFYPGASLMLMLAVSFGVALWLGYLYSAIGALAPRNGADYLLTSRVLHPGLAFIVSWTGVVAASMMAGVVIVTIFRRILPLFLDILVRVAGNRQVVSAAGWLQTPYAVMLLSTLSVMLIFLLLILPHRATRRIFIAGALLTVAAWGVLSWQLSTVHADAFAAGFDQALGPLAYIQHLTGARGLGMVLDPRPQTAIFAGLLMALWIFYGFQQVTNLAGEVKRPERSLPGGILAGIVICFALLGLALYFLSRAAPAQWLAAESFLLLHAPRINALPWLPFYGALLAPKPALIWLGGIAWIYGALNLAHMFLYSASRVVVAWSNDRILPQQVGYIHPALHSPVIAVLGVCIAAETGVAVTIIDPAGTFLYSPYLLFFLLMLVPLAALALAPFRRPDMFAAAPGFVRWRVGRLPGITLLSGLALIYLLFMIAGNLAYRIHGGMNALALLLFGVLIGIGMLLYFSRRAMLQDQGQDLEAGLRELPE